MFELAEPGSDPLAGEITDERFAWSARVAAGFGELVADYFLGGLSYFRIVPPRTLVVDAPSQGARGSRLTQ